MFFFCLLFDLIIEIWPALVPMLIAMASYDGWSPKHRRWIRTALPTLEMRCAARNANKRPRMPGDLHLQSFRLHRNAGRFAGFSAKPLP
jgi:hypothetical protein